MIFAYAAALMFMVLSLKYLTMSFVNNQSMDVILEEERLHFQFQKPLILFLKHCIYAIGLSALVVFVAKMVSIFFPSYYLKINQAVFYGAFVISLTSFYMYSLVAVLVSLMGQAISRFSAVFFGGAILSVYYIYYVFMSNFLDMLFSEVIAY